MRAQGGECNAPALSNAAFGGRLDLVEILLSAGADVAAVDKVCPGYEFPDAVFVSDMQRGVQDGATPIFVAAWKHPLGIVTYLADHGADVNAATNVRCVSSLSSLLYAFRRVWL